MAYSIHNAQNLNLSHAPGAGTRSTFHRRQPGPAGGVIRATTTLPRSASKQAPRIRTRRVGSPCRGKAPPASDALTIPYRRSAAAHTIGLTWPEAQVQICRQRGMATCDPSHVGRMISSPRGHRAIGTPRNLAQDDHLVGGEDSCVPERTTISVQRKLTNQ
jgi:hypothetical protein